MGTSELRAALADIVDEVAKTDAAVTLGAYRVPKAVLISMSRLERIAESVAASFAIDGHMVTQSEKDAAKALALGEIDFDEYKRRVVLRAVGVR